MNAMIVKIALSLSILVSICVISPMIGLTVSPIDEREGMMIDYGYYNVDWIQFDLEPGTNGIQALEKACEIRRDAGEASFVAKVNSYGDVTSVNGYPNMVSSSWGMYVLRGMGYHRGWEPVQDPQTFDVGSEKIIAWARVSDAGSMMPAVDFTGHTYYSYAEAGKNVYGEPLRIVTLAPSVTETLVAVGGLDYIVGIDKYSNYPSELEARHRAGSIAHVGGYTDPNYELIVSTSPDLVFLDGSVGEHVLMADKLRKSGINTVVMYEVAEMRDLMKNLWIAASAIGLSQKGNEYNKELTSTVDALCAVTNIQSCKVVMALSTNESPFVAGGNTYADSIMESIGATNVFSNVKNWGKVDREEIYNRQPDAIIVIYGDGRITSDKEYSDVLRGLSKTWKETPAFSTKSIYIFSGKSADLLSRPGARLGAAAELIAKVLNPDAFIAQDYWDRCPKYFADDYQEYLRYQGEAMLV